MMTCQEVTETIASDGLETAGWRKRLRVKVHLLLCRHCRSYARQLAAIGDAVRRFSGKEPRPSPELEEAILRRCLKDPE